MLYYVAVLNGVVAPVLMVLIVLLSSDKKIMGRHVNGKLAKICGWFITIFMLAASVAFFLTN